MDHFSDPVRHFFCVLCFSSSEYNCPQNDLSEVQGVLCNWKCYVKVCFLFKKWYQEELIQVNLMAHVREGSD